MMVPELVNVLAANPVALVPSQEPTWLEERA